MFLRQLRSSVIPKRPLDQQRLDHNVYCVKERRGASGNIMSTTIVPISKPLYIYLRGHEHLSERRKATGLRPRLALLLGTLDFLVVIPRLSIFSYSEHLPPSDINEFRVTTGEACQDHAFESLAS